MLAAQVSGDNMPLPQRGQSAGALFGMHPCGDGGDGPGAGGPGPGAGAGPGAGVGWAVLLGSVGGGRVV